MTSMVKPSSQNSNEDVTLFDAAQAEVLLLMMRDSWVRYLQSDQFAEYSRDHMKNPLTFVDSVESKVRASDPSEPNSFDSLEQPSRSVNNDLSRRVSNDPSM